MTPCIAPSKRAVFLDRDGVINQSRVRNGVPLPPARVADFHLIDGVPDACRMLKDAGFLLVVATNQPDVGRGTLAQSEVEAIHAAMVAALPIDRVEVCYDPADSPESPRRKPKPGMLLDAASALGIDLGNSYMVGDRWRDVDCGRAAGCSTVFIDYGYGEPLRAQPDLRARDLLEAARAIVARENSLGGTQHGNHGSRSRSHNS